MPIVQKGSMKQSHFLLNIEPDLTLYTQVWEPNAEARGVILLLHGWGEHSQRYWHVAQALTQAGFVTAATDLRGHGRTSGARGFVRSYRDELFSDVTRLLERLTGDYGRLPTFLYGHSTGGGIVLGYTLHTIPSINGVIATSPWLTLKEEPAPIFVSAMRLIKKVHPHFTNELGYTENILSRDPEIDRLAQADGQMHAFMSAGLFIEAMDNGRFVMKNPHQFPLPLLLMHGSGDQITSFESSHQFAQKMHPSRITFKAWPEAFHELHNDIIKNEVITFMVEWLNQQLEGK